MEHVEVARADDARGEVVLRRRTDDNAVDVLELRVNGVFVMDTLETSTEHALAEVALAQVADPRNVLVGGLGLGFTMHAVLEDVRVEKVVVVEIEGALIDWMRDGTVPHGPEYLADARLTIVNLDIAVAVEELIPGGYDLVLLDVDNGPGHLVHDGNAAPLPARLPGRRTTRAGAGGCPRDLVGRPVAGPARPRCATCTATCPR